jgi:uncharacterized protein
MDDASRNPPEDVLVFEWDPAKNQANIRKHSLNFADAVHLFRRRIVVALDEREDYGEDRSLDRAWFAWRAGSRYRL